MRQKGFINIALTVLILSILLFVILFVSGIRTIPFRPISSPPPAPSRLIRIEPLTADPDHDVLVLAECDLAVRYNKRTFVPVTVFVNSKGEEREGYYFRADPIRSIQIYEDYSAVDAALGPGGPARIGIECFSAGIIGEANPTTLFSPMFTRLNTLEATTTDKNVFCATIGLERVSCEQIAVFKKFLATGQDVTYNMYAWETSDFSYILADKGRNQVKLSIQLDHLGLSTPSIDLNDLQFKYYRW